MLKENKEVVIGETGEIVHRTPHAMFCYLNDPEKTQEAFKNGWFHSGDLGEMDEEGYITIVDRKKDIINTGGVSVASREVEEVIYQLNEVSRSEEHTSELQSRGHLVCRLLLKKKKLT